MPPFVGQSIPRVDGPSKVQGRAIYVDDMVVPGALFGATVRSQVARGRLRGITKDPSFNWSGVVVLTHADVPHNEVALIELDQPILARDEIRHCYEPVALVACEDPVRLQHAVAAITLDVEPLPPLLTLDDALECAQVIHGKDNVQKRYLIEHELAQQPIEQILAGCDVVLSGRYRVHHQEQLYIEPQGMVAWWDSGGVHVTGSLQCPYYVQKAIKHAFALPDAQVHITQAVTGGGFGGKEEYPSLLAAHAALLARAAKRPVRMIYGRKEDIEATTKRHPARVDVTTGCTKDGELVAVHVKCVMDGGAYVTLTPVVLSRGILHAAGAYRWKHARIEGTAVATNTPPNGAFRGFGAPQTIWAIERHMDRLADKLGKEPLAFKRERAMTVGSTTVTGQLLKESVGVDDCVARALHESDYAKKRAEYDAEAKRPSAGNVRRGIGASVFLHGAGFTGSGERKLKGKVCVHLETGGRLRIRSALTDIGQGTETVFRQLAADAARIPMDRVAVETPNTTGVPDSGPTVASRTVMVVGSIVAQGAKTIGERVRAFAAGKSWPATMPDDFARAADALLLATGERISELVTYEPNLANQWDDDAYRGDAYPCYAWGCDIAEVEVDVDTFEVKVLGFWAAQDIGKAIHPVMCAGQVEGGTLQAIGWALYEDVVWKDGKILNARMTNYVIPTSKDSPPFHTILVEHPFSGGPHGAKGVGELPMDGGAPAIAAAIEQALGLRCDDLPLLPEKLFEAMRRAREASR